jgi:putative peptide zinc metalloprotease protein
MASDPENAPVIGLNTRIRLCQGVDVIRRGDELVLVAPNGNAAVRVGNVGERLLPFLARGSGFRDLAEILRQDHPQSRDIESKLSQLVATLSRSQLVIVDDEATRGSRRTRRFPLVDLNPIAARVASLLVRAPRCTLVCGGGLLLCAASAGVLAVAGQDFHLLHPSGLVCRFDRFGFMAFVLMVVPLHEISHAVACRMAGAAISSAGLVLHGGIVPGPYVDTTAAYRVRARWRRFSIPAVGPAVDLVTSGTAAWFVRVSPAESALSQASLYLMLLGLVALILDTNPFNASDGSHMVEAFLNDELARRSALSREVVRPSRRSIVSLYRWICGVYASVALIGAIFALRGW